MPLRWKVVSYLAAIHAVLAAVAVLALRDRPLWLLAAELLFALSLVLGYLLIRAFFVPLQLIRTGAELVAEKDFTSTFRPVGQPEMDALIGVYNRMIGELRSERLRLQEQHHFLDEVLAASPAGVVTLDFDGRVSAANPAAARLLGHAPEALAGRRLDELPGALGAELSALPAGESRVLALGSRRLKASRGELYDRGFPRSFFLLEELTEELRASEKAAYEKLIRTLSHEVNNSIGPVLSLLESIREDGGDGEAADREDLDRALAVAATRLDHLRAFMRGYADVVRLPPPERRPCDVATLVEEILLLLGPELARRRIAWAWDERREAPPVELDRNQLEQVLVNVLQNAMEAIDEDGRIGVSLTLEATAHPVLAIRDTGPGISEEARNRLFTPFFSTKRNGRGLGLTLAHEILTQHGFDFALESHPEGGAEFRVRF
ncbi:MAG TPA: ATP-binding protein [Thermoanaerobaculia bacterium]|nr:ATP-binding protein [Thermoanaerobaculia bacterium]